CQEQSAGGSVVIRPDRWRSPRLEKRNLDVRRPPRFAPGMRTALFLLAFLVVACGRESRATKGTGSTEAPATGELAIGSPAPDFSSIAHDGTKLVLSELRGKHVVLYFYPKDETPGCTKEACAFRDA